MNFELPKLPYSYSALEPTIDAQTMELHYSKHHQGYVNNLNAALQKHPDVQYTSLEELLKNWDKLPADIMQAVRNNGGGHYNHSLFWTVLAPNATQPQGKLLNAINQSFGDLQSFKTAFEDAGKKQFGSGWVWLVKAPDGTLKITSTPNQDIPFAMGKPIFCVDLWEHSYDLKYQNRRPDYLSAIWNVVNWQQIENLYN